MIMVAATHKHQVDNTLLIYLVAEVLVILITAYKTYSTAFTAHKFNFGSTVSMCLIRDGTHWNLLLAVF